MQRNSTTGWMAVFILIVLVVTGMRYYDYVMKRNFLLEVATACDPSSESCFTGDCSDGADCDNSTYKKVEIKASEAPICLEEHTCEVFSCEGIEDCSITYCSDESLEDGEKCAVIESEIENTTDTATTSDNSLQNVE